MAVPASKAETTLTFVQRAPRKSVEDPRGSDNDKFCNCAPDSKGKTHPLQKVGTCDVFGLDFTDYLVPLLHVHLGVVNKLLTVLDNAAKLCDRVWQKANPRLITRSSKGKFCGPNPANNHLAFVLAKYGIRREQYYTGTMPGVPCAEFMKPSKMKEIVSEFFNSALDDLANGSSISQFLYSGRGSSARRG